MNRILFIVHTEYHLLITTKIIFDNFNDNKYEIEIILGKEPGKTRLKESYDFSILKNVSVTLAFYDEFDRVPNQPLKLLVRRILNTRYHKLFFFQEHHPLNVYLAYQFHKRGVTVCLCPDGAKAYSRITRIAPRWSTLAFIWYHRFLIANGFYFWKMPWPNLRYASFNFVDEVWLTYTEKYLNWNNKYLVKIDNEFNNEALDIIRGVFSFSNEGLLVRDNIIFFINQNFGLEQMNQFEIYFLNELRIQHPDKSIIIKRHPNTAESHIKNLSKIPNVVILDSNVPAELYILNLNNSLIVSFWSTSNLTYNSSCRYYWAYPMIIDRGIMYKHFQLSDPTDFIIHVNSVEEIK